MKNIYRAEAIGSLLRPGYLWDARRSLRSKEITLAQFKQVEDRAADEALALQESAGLDVVTDGEVRRISFIGPLSDVVAGLEPMPVNRQWHEAGKVVEFKMGLAVTGKVHRRRSLVTEEFAYARRQAKKPLKVTLPSPLMLNMFWSPEHSSGAYSDPFQLFADTADIVREEVRDLAAIGCEYIQIDAPELAVLVDPVAQAALYEKNGISSKRLLSEGVDLINAVGDAPGVTFGLHTCRGNNDGRWLAEGGYDVILKEIVRRATNFQIFLLEYDSPRAGSFAALADIPKDKTVVLGLVSTKTAEMEPFEGLVKRIDEAARYFPREQMALSTQCGFNSGVRGNPIGEAAQEKKLRLVAETAHRVWP
ncbi:MAG: cobalamin-independent methionine synthase II family protein [Candidatus Binatus sp.]